MCKNCIHNTCKHSNKWFIIKVVRILCLYFSHHFIKQMHVEKFNVLK